MSRPKKPPEPKENEASILERMDKALKKMMSTPHETQREMIERRRREARKPLQRRK